MNNQQQQEYTLKRTGKPVLRFVGAIVAAAPGDYNARRRHNLTLYRTASDDGRYVVSIEYLTDQKGERGHADAIPATSGEEVARALAGHDPTAHVVGFPPGEQFAAKQDRLLREIRSAYAEQVSALLDQAGIVEELK